MGTKIIDTASTQLYYIGIAGNHTSAFDEKTTYHSPKFNEDLAAFYDFLYGLFEKPIIDNKRTDGSGFEFRHTKKTLNQSLDSILQAAENDSDAAVIINISAHGNSNKDGPYIALTDTTRIWMKDIFALEAYQSLEKNETPTLLITDFCKCGTTSQIKPENTSLISSRPHEDNGDVRDSVMNCISEFMAIDLLTGANQLDFAQMHKRAVNEYSKSKYVSNYVSTYQFDGDNIVIDVSNMTTERRKMVSNVKLGLRTTVDDTIIATLGQSQDGLKKIEPLQTLILPKQYQSQESIQYFLGILLQEHSQERFSMLLDQTEKYAGEKMKHAVFDLYFSEKYKHLHDRPYHRHSNGSSASLLGWTMNQFNGILESHRNENQLIGNMVDTTIHRYWEVVNQFEEKLSEANSRLSLGVSTISHISMILDYEKELDMLPALVNKIFDRVKSDSFPQLARMHKTIYNAIMESKFPKNYNPIGSAQLIHDTVLRPNYKN